MVPPMLRVDMLHSADLAYENCAYLSLNDYGQLLREHNPDLVGDKDVVVRVDHCGSQRATRMPGNINDLYVILYPKANPGEGDVGPPLVIVVQPHLHVDDGSIALSSVVRQRLRCSAGDLIRWLFFPTTGVPPATTLCVRLVPTSSRGAALLPLASALQRVHEVFTERIHVVCRMPYLVRMPGGSIWIVHLLRVEGGTDRQIGLCTAATRIRWRINLSGESTTP